MQYVGRPSYFLLYLNYQRYPKTMKRIVSTAFLLFTLLTSVRAEVKLPVIFSDHMVLQRGEPVAIWGTAAPSESVKVTFGNQTLETQAGADGKWKVTLAAMKEEAKPADLVIAGKNTLTIKDVLVGEVWVCSGQSNMQWTVAQAANPEKEIASAKFPSIRMFNLDREVSAQPKDDCKGKWLETNPENAGQFSAVGYFFGRHLHQVLNVPIGLINTSWGGTRVEAWTSHEALSERPCARDMLQDWATAKAKYDAESAAKVFEQQKTAWQAQVKAIQERNAKLKPGDAKENNPPAPRPADNPNATPHHPSVLYNAMIAPIIPFGIKGAIWYQGESNQKRAVQYQELLPTMINDWRKRWNDEFSFYIVQLANFGNGKPITTEAGMDDTWAELQEAQALTAQTLPKCGMAVINDIGDEKDIHPKNKQEVGRRLALIALAQDYGKKDIVHSGPVLKSSKVTKGKVRVQFDHVGGGLKTRDGKAPGSFQILGTDQKWHWAKAAIEGNEVVVWSDAVKQPAGVRYAWAAWPVGANQINKEGLPVSCYRTDDSLLSTLGVVSPFAENLPAKR